MRKLIQTERQIELAFEEHRYWDVRRWKIAKKCWAVLVMEWRLHAGYLMMEAKALVIVV